MKIDHDEQVNQLFTGKPIKSETVIDMSQKKFVFGLLNETKDRQNKAQVDALWKKFMAMPENKTLKRGTNEQILSSKQQLIEIIEELERDNLVMYAPDDGNVILI